MKFPFLFFLIAPLSLCVAADPPCSRIILNMELSRLLRVGMHSHVASQFSLYDIAPKANEPDSHVRERFKFVTLLARSLIGSNQLKEAITLYRRNAGHFPNAEDAMLNQAASRLAHLVEAIELAQNDNYMAALQRIPELMEESDHTSEPEVVAEVYKLAGRTHLRMRNTEKAISAFNGGLETIEHRETTPVTDIIYFEEAIAVIRDIYESEKLLAAGGQGGPAEVVPLLAGYAPNITWMDPELALVWSDTLARAYDLLGEIGSRNLLYRRLVSSIANTDCLSNASRTKLASIRASIGK